VKLKKGDQVLVLGGKDKGQKGKIEKVLVKENKVLVAEVNMYKKHLRPQGEKQPGGVVEISKPLPASRVALICPKCGKKTRIGYKVTQDSKLRICKQCQAAI